MTKEHSIKTEKYNFKSFLRLVYNFYDRQVFASILILSIIGYAAFRIIDVALADGDIYKHNLEAIEQIAATISVVFSGIAILLLYKNYRLQQKEMIRLNEANASLVRGTIKANDLQVVLYEKQRLDSEFDDFLNNNRIFQRASIEHEIQKINKLISYIRINKSDTEKRLLLNQLFYKEKEKEDELFNNIFDFIFHIWLRINTVEKLVESNESINLFFTSLSQELITLLQNLYSNDMKSFIELYLSNYGENPYMNRVNKILLFRDVTNVLKGLIEKNT